MITSVPRLTVVFIGQPLIPYVNQLSGLLPPPSTQGGLGRPLIPDADQLSRLSPDTLRAFLGESFTGDRLILAASGVEHAKLVDLVQAMLEQVRRCGA